MKLFAIICSLLIVAAAASDVLILTDETFEDEINKHDVAFVKFYAPWCGHCKSLAPKWKEVAAKFKDSENVAIAQVDCTEHSAVCGKYQVQGYPTLKVFLGGVSGSVDDYQGDRSTGALIEFVEKKTVPPISVLSSAEEIEAALNDDDSDSNVVIYVKEDNAEVTELLTSVARKFEDLDWSLVVDGDLDESAKVVVTGDHIEEPLSYSLGSPVDTEALSEYLSKNAYAPVQELSQVTWSRAHARMVPMVIGVADYTEEGTVPDDFLQIMNEAAEEYGDRYAFIYGDSKQLGNAVKNIGGTGTVYPILLVLCAHDDVKESYAGPDNFVWREGEEITAEGVKKWLQEGLDGTVVPFRKSAPVPEENDGPVRVLVGNTFDEEIASKKFAFVKFYAPWCGHCKSLAPIWEELAETATSDDVLIAKLDGTENYMSPEFGVTSYPTLLWFEDGKLAERYSGGRTLEDLQEYINKQVSGEADAAEEDEGSDHVHDEL